MIGLVRTLGAAATSAAVVLGIGLPVVFERHAGARAVATTADVQDFDRLWGELSSLREDAAEGGAAEFRVRAVARTVEYLGLDPEERIRFVAVVEAALADVAAARARVEETSRETAADPLAPASVAARRDAWEVWQREQADASDRLLEVLEAKPRHRLLAEQRLLWLLKLDYGTQ